MGVLLRGVRCSVQPKDPRNMRREPLPSGRTVGFAPAGGQGGTAPGGLARRRHPSMMFIGRVSVQRYLAGTQFVLLTGGTVGSPTSKL